MGRVAVAGVVVLAAALASCSSGTSAAKVFGSAPACPLLAQLALTGRTVENTDVSDPAVFEATLHDAITKYVQTAKQLRGVVPASLRPDVDRMVTAAQQRHFSDGDDARAAIDGYARTACETT